jgi:hypothetical protein
MDLVSSAPQKERDIEITPELIRAAAEVLWMHPLFDIPESVAEELAAEMLERSFSLSREKTSATGPTSL